MKRNWITPGHFTYDLFTDALSAPHLLVAGSTGSGKSVLLNDLIFTLLQRFPTDIPYGAGFILIDPKRVELAAYKDLPHAIRHVSGRDCDGWADALALAVRIMDNRYDQMEKEGLKLYSGADIYVVIDEFASINNPANSRRRECTAHLMRLANEGRAARMHIILATQTPKADVLPTHIRNNFDTRFCLKTEDRTQSRLLMGEAGCELLPDPRLAGEALGFYKSGFEKKLYRLPYISEEEIQEAIDHWMAQMKPKRLFSFLHKAS